MNNRLSKVKLGILGGGQLARMIALKCHEMGIKPYVLGSHPQDPAAQITPYFIQGKFHSKTDLKNFFNKVDLAIFENEFLDPALLHEISVSTNTPIHPKPKIMHHLQNRLSQKLLLKKFKIPTARFIEVHSQKQINTLAKKFPKGMVLKKRHAGYDGYGTLIVTDILKDRRIEQFAGENPRLIAEELIPFKKEMAIILVRNRKKQIIELPLVETHQEQARCLWVKGPCQHKKKNSLLKQLKTMINEINYEGVIAFELFETKQGSLMVNEVAPRVHNSGHYSMNALSEDQFSLHIKAVMNLDIQAPVKYSGGFAMLNLLGEKTPGQWLPPTGTILHWYGKEESRPNRKMGHLNSLSSTSNKALTTLLNFKKKYLKY